MCSFFNKTFSVFEQAQMQFEHKTKLIDKFHVQKSKIMELHLKIKSGDSNNTAILNAETELIQQMIEDLGGFFNEDEKRNAKKNSLKLIKPKDESSASKDNKIYAF